MTRAKEADIYPPVARGREDELSTKMDRDRLQCTTFSFILITKNPLASFNKTRKTARVIYPKIRGLSPKYANCYRDDGINSTVLYVNVDYPIVQ